MSEVDWIGVDWGTSRFRAWGLSHAGDILSTKESDCGMSSLQPAEFEPVLLQHIAPWLAPDRRVHVFACGMVGARQGWVEVPYRTLPCRPLGSEIPTQVQTAEARLAAYILPGIKQDDPPDVMRGEETQIAGYLAGNADFEGTICLPGTHSKWAAVRQGLIERITTFMTGEMFALLSERSVLRHSVTSEEWSDEAFIDAVGEAFVDPAPVAARLFAIRAADLLAGLTPSEARSRLSGLLIGLELGAMGSSLPINGTVLIGADPVARLYARALESLGFPASIVDGTAATLAGLTVAWQQMTETAAPCGN